MPPAKRGARGRLSPLVRHRRHRGTRYPPPFPVLPPPTAPLLLPCGVPSPPASPLCLLPPPDWVGEVTPGNRAWNAQQITFSAPVGEGSAGGNPPTPPPSPSSPLQPQVWASPLACRASSAWSPTPRSQSCPRQSNNQWIATN